jgi:hypothetical protein
MFPGPGVCALFAQNPLSTFTARLFRRSERPLTYASGRAEVSRTKTAVWVG